MSALITLAIIGTYLALGARHVMPFARDHVRKERNGPHAIIFSGPYAVKHCIDDLNREAIWVGVTKALFWPYVLVGRWITRNLVNSLTAEERKAEELKEARRVIAEYEAEQATKNGLVPWKF